MQFLNGLEIKYIYHEDELHLGKRITNLAKLYHAGLPVAEGIVVLPPIDEISAIIKDLRLNSPVELSERESQLKKRILNIKLPSDLKNKYKKYHFDRGWENLLLQWFVKVKNQILLKEKIQLEPKVIFLVHKPMAYGSAFRDPYTKKIEVKIEGGQLPEEYLPILETLIKKCDQTLIIHQRYDWIFDNTLKIIGVKHLSVGEPKREEFDEVKIREVKKNTTKKGSTKIFYDATDNFSPDQDIDGVIIDSALIYPDSGSVERLERKVWKLAETCLNNYSLPILYKLNKERLKEDAEVISFIRHKKQLLNLQIGIPICKSSDDLAEVKKELASFGLSRKGSLKIWVELGSGENFINLDEYLDVGVDGVIVNVDLLAQSLYGTQEEVNTEKAAHDIKKYLEGHLPQLKKANMPILLFGSLLNSDDLIRFLVEKKIWGIVINTSEQYGLKHYIHEVERFFFTKTLESY